MKFLCEESCYDNGNLQRLDKRGVPIRFGYKRGIVYDSDDPKGYITEAQLFHLTRVGLFPEFFSYADDLARVWVDQHNDELCDIVDARGLPYRKLTPEEEQNDEDVLRGRKAGKFTLARGPVEMARVKLVRKGKPVAQAFLDGTPSPLLPEEINRIDLKRKAAVPLPPRGRKPMSAEARAAASERLKAARAKKAAARQAVAQEA